MGKVKTKGDKVVFEDIDKEIEKATPKKVKKTEEKPKKVKEAAKKTNEMQIKELRKDLDKLGNWVADMDDDFMEISKMIDRMAKRMGLE
tara:strand:+ start:2355 stop:2621 length:267 start_codon:yes stop_codon:yes gene_type:complete